MVRPGHLRRLNRVLIQTCRGGERESGVELVRLDGHRWLIPKQGKMRVDGLIFADERLMRDIRRDEAVKQVANVATAKTFGLNVEDLIGKTADELYPPGSADWIAEHDREAIRLGKPVSFDETITLEGREIHRPAVPAEDMMQAFIYHHLVPASELMVALQCGGS